MARSRSSFELTSAIAAASTLAREEKKPGAPVTDPAQFRGVALVSFQGAEPAPAAPAAPAEPAAPAREARDVPTRELPKVTRAPVVEPPADSWGIPPSDSAARAKPLAIPPPPPAEATPSDRREGGASASREEPLRVPDLSGVASPIVRCEKVIAWIAETTGAAGIFIADAEGLPVAGDIHDAEARIAASGMVATSIATLQKALPGRPSPLFEVHVGEGDGPFFQLIGFWAGRGMFVVGLTRHEPLSQPQAQAIRLACRLAFGEPSSVAPGGEP